MGTLTLDGKSRNALLALGCRAWDESGLMLIPAELLPQLAHGVVLESVTGRTVTVGVDEIDDDTRYGLLAFGVRPKREKS